MASEALNVPEEHLQDVINVILAGLERINVSNDVLGSLTHWCNEMQEYVDSWDEPDEAEEKGCTPDCPCQCGDDGCKCHD